MLRTGKTWQYRREALPIAEDESNSTARLRPVQDTSIIRETVQLLVAPLIFRCIAFRSRALHSQNWPDSLRKPNWTDTPALGFAACCLRFDPDARKLAIIPLRSSVGESGNHVIALARRCQATSPDAPTKYRELRGGVRLLRFCRHASGVVEKKAKTYATNTQSL